MRFEKVWTENSDTCIELSNAQINNRTPVSDRSIVMSSGQPSPPPQASHNTCWLKLKKFKVGFITFLCLADYVTDMMLAAELYWLIGFESSMNICGDIWGDLLEIPAISIMICSTVGFFSGLYVLHSDYAQLKSNNLEKTNKCRYNLSTFIKVMGEDFATFFIVMFLYGGGIAWLGLSDTALYSILIGNVMLLIEGLKLLYEVNRGCRKKSGNRPKCWCLKLTFSILVSVTVLGFIAFAWFVIAIQDRPYTYVLMVGTPTGESVCSWLIHWDDFVWGENGTGIKCSLSDNLVNSTSCIAIRRYNGTSYRKDITVELGTCTGVGDGEETCEDGLPWLSYYDGFGEEFTPSYDYENPNVEDEDPYGEYVDLYGEYVDLYGVLNHTLDYDLYGFLNHRLDCDNGNVLPMDFSVCFDYYPW